MSDRSIRERITEMLMMRGNRPVDPRIPPLTGAMYPPRAQVEYGAASDPNVPPLGGAMYPPEQTDYEEFYGRKGRR